jgi:RNA polymerase sigma-70 factor (ECF subfamily)
VDDVQLLQAIRNGDEGAFDALFRRYYAPLVGFAEAMLRGTGASEDIVQDVFLEFWRRREIINAGDSCKAYLFRSVRNRALNAIRHDSNVRRLEPVVRDEAVALEAPAADVSAGVGELDLAIRDAVHTLREPIRECFLLSRRDKLTYGQIAEVLGVSVKTVEARMGAALRELREKLAAWLPA